MSSQLSQSLSQGKRWHWKHRTIWHGQVEWEESYWRPTAGMGNADKVQKNAHCLLVSSIVNGSPEVRMESWPAKMVVEYLPNAIMDGMDVKDQAQFNELTVKLSSYRNAGGGGHPGLGLSQQLRIFQSVGLLKFFKREVGPDQEYEKIPNAPVVLLIPIVGKRKRYVAGVVPKNQNEWMAKIRGVRRQRERQAAAADGQGEEVEADRNEEGFARAQEENGADAEAQQQQLRENAVAQQPRDNADAQVEADLNRNVDEDERWQRWQANEREGRRGGGDGVRQPEIENQAGGGQEEAEEVQNHREHINNFGLLMYNAFREEHNYVQARPDAAPLRFLIPAPEPGLPHPYMHDHLAYNARPIREQQQQRRRPPIRYALYDGRNAYRVIPRGHGDHVYQYEFVPMERRGLKRKWGDDDEDCVLDLLP